MRIICLIVTLVLFCTFFFFFNDTATTEIYTLSLHDALPILIMDTPQLVVDAIPSISRPVPIPRGNNTIATNPNAWNRSEEHTSELQSHSDLVCRLLLEKKKKNTKKNKHT